MRSHTTLVFFLLLFLISAETSAENVLPTTPKFGKVSQKELELSKCIIDSSASAVILFDVGDSKMIYNHTDGNFVLRTQRHVRIKILTKDGMDYANIEIPAYNNGDKREKITNIKPKHIILKMGK